MNCRIIHGDCRDVLKTLPDESVHCCVTSPPYWGLRDYGVNGQIGLEPTMDDFISEMVAVFNEVRRVLRKDGTCWINLGDSYAAHPGQSKTTDKAGSKQTTNRGAQGTPSRSPLGLKPKDICGIPWRVAFALQDNGWYLRQDIIWHKPNPMPESVTDRCTKAHEYVFLLSKSERYYYDAGAIKEKVTGNAHERGDGVNPKAKYKTPDGWDTSKGEGGNGSFHKNGREKGKTPGRNSRIFQDRMKALVRPFVV